VTRARSAALLLVAPLVEAALRGYTLIGDTAFLAAARAMLSG